MAAVLPVGYTFFVETALAHVGAGGMMQDA
jgi:hypothetical protein